MASSSPTTKRYICMKSRTANSMPRALFTQFNGELAFNVWGHTGWSTSDWASHFEESKPIWLRNLGTHAEQFARARSSWDRLNRTSLWVSHDASSGLWKVRVVGCVHWSKAEWAANWGAWIEAIQLHIDPMAAASPIWGASNFPWEVQDPTVSTDAESLTLTFLLKHWEQGHAAIQTPPVWNWALDLACSEAEDHLNWSQVGENIHITAAANPGWSAVAWEAAWWLWLGQIQAQSQRAKQN